MIYIKYSNEVSQVQDNELADESLDELTDELTSQKSMGWVGRWQQRQQAKSTALPERAESPGTQMEGAQKRGRLNCASHYMTSNSTTNKVHYVREYDFERILNIF